MTTIFDEATLRKLEQLTLTADKVRIGQMKGDRRSKKRGTSIEFADYRNYTKGDDLRRLDWNVYARLERPFIKLLEEEEDLAHVASGRMIGVGSRGCMALLTRPRCEAGCAPAAPRAASPS